MAETVQFVQSEGPRRLRWQGLQRSHHRGESLPTAYDILGGRNVGDRVATDRHSLGVTPAFIARAGPRLAAQSVQRAAGFFTYRRVNQKCRLIR
jgi:hypothetical protein